MPRHRSGDLDIGLECVILVNLAFLDVCLAGTIDHQIGLQPRQQIIHGGCVSQIGAHRIRCIHIALLLGQTVTR